MCSHSGMLKVFVCQSIVGRIAMSRSAHGHRPESMHGVGIVIPCVTAKKIISTRSRGRVPRQLLLRIVASVDVPAFTSNWTELGILHAGAIACVGMIAACKLHVAQESAGGIASSRQFLLCSEHYQSACCTAQARYLAEDGRVDGVANVLPQRRKRVQTCHLPSKKPGMISDELLTADPGIDNNRNLLATPGEHGNGRDQCCRDMITGMPCGINKHTCAAIVKPTKASIARRPFLISFSCSSAMLPCIAWAKTLACAAEGLWYLIQQSKQAQHCIQRHGNVPVCQAKSLLASTAYLGEVEGIKDAARVARLRAAQHSRQPHAYEFRAAAAGENLLILANLVIRQLVVGEDGVLVLAVGVLQVQAALALHPAAAIRMVSQNPHWHGRRQSVSQSAGCSYVLPLPGRPALWYRCRQAAHQCMAKSSKATRPTMLKGSWICVGAEYQKMSGRKISCRCRLSCRFPASGSRLKSEGRKLVAYIGRLWNIALDTAANLCKDASDGEHSPSAVHALRLCEPPASSSPP